MPRQLANAPHAHPVPESPPFPPRGCPLGGVRGIRRRFRRLFPWAGQVAYVLLTRAPVAGGGIAASPLPLDLHVLGLSLAFILSQDQTLRCCYVVFSFFKDRCPRVRRSRAPRGAAHPFIVAFLVIDRVGCNPLRDCALSCTTSFSIVSLSMFFRRLRRRCARFSRQWCKVKDNFWIDQIFSRFLHLFAFSSELSGRPACSRRASSELRVQS